MAKVSLSAIAPIKKIDPVIIQINGQDIEVIQYLPTQEKLALVERVLNRTIDETNFFNPVRMEVYTVIEIISTYTNISITEKMIENAPKTFDTLIMNKVIDAVIAAIPEEEYDTVFDAVEDCAIHITNYLNSIQGVLKGVAQDYDVTKMNIDELMKTLDQPEKVGLLKDILDKVG